MKTITSLFVAFGLLAGLAVAGEGEGCPSQCKASEGKPTALAAARKGLADVPKAFEKLPEAQQAEIKAARELLSQTSFGKAMGPAFEACGHLTLAAAKQEGTSAEAAAILKDMAATYCTVAKAFGGCSDCGDCCEEGSKECCKEMTAEKLAAKANEALASSKKLLAAAGEEMKNAKPEEMQKVMAAAETMHKLCPCGPAMEAATKALNEAYAALGKMGVPASTGAGVRDQLVKGAFELHTSLTSCSSCEESCEEKCDESEEKPAETTAPEKSS